MFASRTPSALLLSVCVAASAGGQEDSQSTRLFNGKNLDGWTCYLGDSDVPCDQVWSVKDGVLHCTGKPTGYLITRRDDFADYRLSLQWRWPGKPGNNGVLVHATTKNELGVWPKSLEVQLQHEHAGDFWVIGTEIDMQNGEQRRDGRRHLNLTDDSEKPLGQWNTMEIVCRGDRVTVRVNGELVNEAHDVSQQQGAIALQSEGAPIEYREIVLSPLEP